MKTVKMVDVVMPTTDGWVVTLPRYVEPKEDVALLLGALGFSLPAQPAAEDIKPRRCEGKGDVVKTLDPIPRKFRENCRERGKPG